MNSIYLLLIHILSFFDSFDMHLSIFVSAISDSDNFSEDRYIFLVEKSGFGIYSIKTDNAETGIIETATDGFTVRFGESGQITSSEIFPNNNCQRTFRQADFFKLFVPNPHAFDFRMMGKFRRQYEFQIRL